MSKETGDIKVLDVTLLEPKQKHPTIFQWFDALEPGQAFMIWNDHDPKPLYYQLMGERGNVFDWQYEEQGPEWWRVIITKRNTPDGPTLGEIAASDMRKVEVFKKYGLDYSCGGKQTLEKACAEKQVDVQQLQNDLQNAASAPRPVFDFGAWQPDFLADYILNQHHSFFYKQEVVIADLLQKVAQQNPGDAQVNVITQLFATLSNELKAHLLKEERILFPLVRQAMLSKASGTPFTEEVKQMKTVIQLLETDHDAVAQQLQQLRQATNFYIAPAGAIDIVILFAKMKELDEDLQQHFHLENNILFTKAAELVKR